VKLAASAAVVAAIQKANEAAPQRLIRFRLQLLVMTIARRGWVRCLLIFILNHFLVADERLISVAKSAKLLSQQLCELVEAAEYRHRPNARN
jgi:hypothetical protein